MTTVADLSPVTVEERSDPRCPTRRLGALFDPGSYRLRETPDGAGVVTAEGCLQGVPALAYCTDARILGGALGRLGCHRIATAIDAAVTRRIPVIGLWHSGGARLAPLCQDHLRQLQCSGSHVRA